VQTVKGGRPPRGINLFEKKFAEVSLVILAEVIGLFFIQITEWRCTRLCKAPTLVKGVKCKCAC
jgi:hypothetical protein